jgi:hypothetical protein
MLLLTQELPPDWTPPPGLRVRWPDDGLVREWTGREWVVRQVAFDGGDAWLASEEPPGAGEASEAA